MPVKRGVADAVRAPLHRARRAALRRSVAPDPHGRRHRADPPGAARRPRSRRCSAACSTVATTTTRAPTPSVLPMLAAAAELDAVPVDERRAVLRERGPAALAEAGFSWERLSGWLPGGMDAEAWEAVIPSMGVMALVRNLRNFDQAGISDAAIDAVIAKITDADEVAHARGCSRTRCGRRTSTRRRTTGSARSAARSSSRSPTSRRSTAPSSSSTRRARCRRRCRAARQLQRVEVAAVMAMATAKRASNVDVVIYGQTQRSGDAARRHVGARRRRQGGAVGRLGRSRHVRPHGHRALVRPEAPPPRR